MGDGTKQSQDSRSQIGKQRPQSSSSQENGGILIIHIHKLLLLAYPCIIRLMMMSLPEHSNLIARSLQRI